MSSPARAAAALAILVIVAGCSSSGAASQPPASLPIRPSPSLDLLPTAPVSGAPLTGEVPTPVLQAVQLQLAKDGPGIDLSAATVVISVHGTEYDYRATGAGQIRLCAALGPIGS